MSSLAATVCDKQDGNNSTDSANFHLNYATISGGLTIADYATSMETTFGIEVTSYGWAKPPLCAGGGTCSGNSNPWGRYPIQVATIGSGLWLCYSSRGLQRLHWRIPTRLLLKPKHSPVVWCSTMIIHSFLKGHRLDCMPPQGMSLSMPSNSAMVIQTLRKMTSGMNRRRPTWKMRLLTTRTTISTFGPEPSNSLGEWPNDDEPTASLSIPTFLFLSCCRKEWRHKHRWRWRRCDAALLGECCCGSRGADCI